MQGLGKEIGDSITLGFELVLPTLFGAFIGYYIDQKLMSFPVALIIGLFIGAAAGFWNVVRKFLLDSKAKKRDG